MLGTTPDQIYTIVLSFFAQAIIYGFLTGFFLGFLTIPVQFLFKGRSKAK